MSNSANPILLRPVLGIVLTTASLLLKSDQLMSRLQSGHHVVSFVPLVAGTVSVKQLRKVLWTLKESGTLVSWSLTAWVCSPVAQGSLGDFSFSTNKKRDTEGALYLGARGKQGSAWLHKDEKKVLLERERWVQEYVELLHESLWWSHRARWR